MKHRTRLTIRQIRKHNTFLTNCANHVNSLILAELILAHVIKGAQIGQAVLKGTNQ